MNEGKRKPSSPSVTVCGDELSFMNRAETVALEVHLPAGAGLIIEIKQQIANRPALEGGDQRAQIWLILGVDRNDFRYFKMAHLEEIPGTFFARKCERPSP